MMIVQEPVQAAIWHCLNHYAYQDATFLAERLCSEVETDESLFILATCYYRSNQTHQAFWLLDSKPSKSPQCRYLLAKCAYDLKKFNVVEIALTNENFAETKHLDQIVCDFGELACFCLQLLSKICHQTERHELATEALMRALKLNPFLWQSFADLCNRGQSPDPNSIFQFNDIETFSTCQSTNLNSLIWFHGSSGINETLFRTIGGGDGDDCYQTTPIGSDGSTVLVTPVNTNVLHTPIISTDDTPMYIKRGQANTNYDATPYRKPFEYLSTLSPGTPSFGVLPINSPSDSAAISNKTQISSNILYSPVTSAIIVPPPATTTISSQQSQQTLAEVNEQKVGGPKKLKVGSLINRKEQPLQLSKPIFNQTGNITPRTPNTNTLGIQNVRRSSRLFSSNNYSVKENSKSPNINKFAAPRSPPRKTKQRVSKMNINNAALNELNVEIKFDKEKIETITSSNDKVLLNNTINTAHTMHQHVLQMKKQSASGLMTLLRQFGQSYVQLSQYNCQEAIETLSEIPNHHFYSAWVQCQLGRAYYELRQYDQSSKIFNKIHQKEPFRLQYMEIYSTVLWHLQKEVQLSTLAQDLLAQNKLSPITWCVAGNCFSLHKEHETAIKFFERAVQVEPDFPYSYTLLGHELVITEELDKAMSCFRTAILKDSRHYNAWFGVGTIYSKQERYHLADIHYKHALNINPNNSVIMVHIGAMQYYMNRYDVALKILNRAVEIDPRNPLCKFHRGTMYYQMGKHQEALRELEELKAIVPKESLVYYLIGKIHKRLGNVDSALMHFSWAADLNPKGANNQVDAFDTNLSQCNAGIDVNGESSDDVGEGSRNTASTTAASVLEDETLLRSSNLVVMNVPLQQNETINDNITGELRAVENYESDEY